VVRWAVWLLLLSGLSVVLSPSPVLVPVLLVVLFLSLLVFLLLSLALLSLFLVPGSVPGSVGVCGGTEGLPAEGLGEVLPWADSGEEQFNIATLFEEIRGIDANINGMRRFFSAEEKRSRRRSYLKATQLRSTPPHEEKHAEYKISKVSTKVQSHRDLMNTFRPLRIRTEMRQEAITCGSPTHQKPEAHQTPD